MERFGEILFQNGKCDDNNQSTIFSDECKVCVPSSAQHMHPLKAVSSPELKEFWILAFVNALMKLRDIKIYMDMYNFIYYITYTQLCFIAVTVSL